MWKYLKLFFCLRSWFPSLPLRFSTLLHNDPAAHQDHCGRCRIRTRDLCPRRLGPLGQRATTSPKQLKWPIFLVMCFVLSTRLFVPRPLINMKKVAFKIQLPFKFPKYCISHLFEMLSVFKDTVLSLFNHSPFSSLFCVFLFQTHATVPLHNSGPAGLMKQPCS